MCACHSLLMYTLVASPVFLVGDAKCGGGALGDENVDGEVVREGGCVVPECYVVEAEVLRASPVRRSVVGVFADAEEIVKCY